MGQIESREVKNMGLLDARQVANLLLGERWDFQERSDRRSSGTPISPETSPPGLPLHIRKIWKKLLRHVFPTTACVKDEVYPTVLPCSLPILFLLDVEKNGSFSGNACMRLVKRIKEVLKEVHTEFQELQKAKENEYFSISTDVEHLETLLKVAAAGLTPTDLLTLASIRRAVAQIELGIIRILTTSITD
eukprot:jgi/Galph1/978/GphlegSOOS_G5729.1